MKPLKIACCIALVASLASPLSAAVVYLKDGTQVSGTVVSATANDVVVHTAEGTRRIPTGRIARIDYAAGAAPAPAGPPPAPPGAGTAPAPRSEWQRLQASGFDNGRQQLSIGLGLAAPLSRVNFNQISGGSGSNGTVGLLVDGQYLYFRTARFAVGAAVDYLHRGATDSTNMLASADTNVWGNTVLLQALARYVLTDHGSARPYLQAGIGPEHTSTFIDATPSPGFAWSDTSTAETRRLVDDGHWGLGGSFAVGLDFDFASPSIFSVEAGWTGVSSASYAATPAGQALGLSDVSGGLSFFTFAARWGWRF